MPDEPRRTSMPTRRLAMVGATGTLGVLGYVLAGVSGALVGAALPTVSLFSWFMLDDLRKTRKRGRRIELGELYLDVCGDTIVYRWTGGDDTLPDAVIAWLDTRVDAWTAAGSPPGFVATGRKLADAVEAAAKGADPDSPWRVIEGEATVRAVTVYRSATRLSYAAAYPTSPSPESMASRPIPEVERSQAVAFVRHALGRPGTERLVAAIRGLAVAHRSGLGSEEALAAASKALRGTVSSSLGPGSGTARGSRRSIA